MENKRAFLIGAILVWMTLGATQAQAQRSFVGKRMTGAVFEDTEGHVIDPTHYKDSVIVLFGGIPW
jgi:hypothetical protein